MFRGGGPAPAAGRVEMVQTVNIGLELLATNFTRETADTCLLIELAGDRLLVVAE